MNPKTYKQIRVGVALFVGAIVSIAVISESYILALVGVVTGMIFLAFVRSKTKIVIDERERAMREKAAHVTYAIFAPTIGIGALLMIIPSSGLFSVFSKGEFGYLESLGMVFAYLTLFLIALYAISYYFIAHKLGGGGSEE